MFHVKAMDEIKTETNNIDSDENEHYVYPYSGNESCTTVATNNNGLHRQLSVRSTPPILNQQRSIGDWIRRTWSPHKEETPVPETEEEEIEWSGHDQSYRRPKLRNRVKDHPTPHRSNSLLNLWHDGFYKKYGWPTASAKKTYFTTQKASALYHQGGGYTSDEEDAPLLRLKRQQQLQQKRSLKNNNRKHW